MTRTAHNARWVIVSVNKPVLMRRSDDETWMLNPRRRYILNAENLEDLAQYIETMSDLEASTLYRPLRSAAEVRLPHSSLLIDRYRDRGLGDLLFTTGPLAYFNHVAGGELKAYLYAYAERGSILNHCPYLVDNSPLVGPVLYDDLPHYNFHWFIDTMTEYCEETDQLNVYDAMYRSLGIDPETVEAKFKRPYITMSPDESKRLDDFFFWIFTNTKPQIDLRKTGYYVIAPFSVSSLRSAPYSIWLQVIEELSRRRPVLVVGALRDRMPTTDMAPGDFISVVNNQLSQSGRVINLIGKTHVRNLVQIISKATAVGSLDSASLYIAQALRTPCVSVWGTHDPGVRIGYDQSYMDLAVWAYTACPNSPCYAWQSFPKNRCPNGENQHVCQCLVFTNPKEIIRRFEVAESRSPTNLKLA